MSVRFSKRGKNPGAVDSWLDSLGYYRKNIAYDETCLFRAVSEQLFFTQIKHEEIRNKVIQYAVDHHDEFSNVVSKKHDWIERLQKLSVHMIICSEIEIRLVSQAFKIDVNVFDAGRRQMLEFKYDENKPSESVIQICRLGEDHYDAIYNKKHIVNTGFCQSIVYGILYENVFELPNVSSTVNAMLHDKDGGLCMYYSEEHHSTEEIASTSNSTIVLAPFPFKVAKALDPNMYRNIEYDSWLETRREFRLGEWYYGDDNLILGTRCLVNLGLEEHQCYIQEFLQNRRCVVFVTKLAQRLTVNYDDLRRESDAKPWPLPYRFARTSLTTPVPSSSETVDSGSKIFRRRKDKKRPEVAPTNPVNADDVEANTFEGCPLVKQESNDVWLAPRPKLSLQILNNNIAPNNEDWGVASESRNGNTGSSESEFYMNFQRSSTAPSPQEAPTSNTYQGDSHVSPVVYTYNQEYSYPSMPVWSNPPYAGSPDIGIDLSDGNASPLTDSGRNSQQKYMYCAQDSAYSSPVIITPVPSMNYGYTDRSLCNTPIMPSGPPRFDVYPFVYSPVPVPTTPVYYPQPPPPPSTFTPVISQLPSIPTHRSQDYIYSPTVNSPVPVYNSPYEFQYYGTPSPYPSAWSYSHLNPQQGFVFPTSVTPNYL